MGGDLTQSFKGEERYEGDESWKQVDTLKARSNSTMQKAHITYPDSLTIQSNASGSFNCSCTHKIILQSTLPNMLACTIAARTKNPIIGSREALRETLAQCSRHLVPSDGAICHTIYLLTQHSQVYAKINLGTNYHSFTPETSHYSNPPNLTPTKLFLQAIRACVLHKPPGREGCCVSHHTDSAHNW